jgi:hypothetical protein
MTEKKRCAFICSLVVVFSLFQSAFANSNFQVKVVPKIISEKISCLPNQSFEAVFIRDHFFYFLEDEKKYSEKEIQAFRKYFDFPSFNLIFFKDNHLVRHFYIITNQKEIKEGLYQIEFQIKKTKKQKTYCLQEIEVKRIKSLDCDLNGIEKKVKKNLYSNRKTIIKTDLSELYRSHKNTVKLQLRDDLFNFDSDIDALNKLEFIGRLNHNFIFGFRLANADNEKAREEDRIARAYFAYIDYNSISGTTVVYLTIAGFSIYIK